MDKATCPNCTQPVVDHPENGCVLAALIGVVRERGNKNEAELIELHADANVDALWDVLGPVIDGLEEGEFSS